VQNETVLNQPFFQQILPLIVTIFVAVWLNNHGLNKAFDALNKRMDDIVLRLDRIETRLLAIETRVTALERKVDALEVKAWR
jgi:hypothetical protein